MLWLRSIPGPADDEVSFIWSCGGRATYRNLSSGFSRAYTLGRRKGTMIGQYSIVKSTKQERKETITKA